MNPNVAILGAGISGLVAARRLQVAGIPFTIFEASDRVGGRIRSNTVDGFTTDAGFQIFFETYEEIRPWLSVEDLDLGYFFSGAKVYDGEEQIEFANPLSETLAAIPAAFGPWATLMDKAKLSALYLLQARQAKPFPPKGETTLAYLQREGFSEESLRRLFRSFFGDVFLDRGLSPDANTFLYLLSKFATTKGSIPAKGMRAIPEAVAAPLPKSSILLHTPAPELTMLRADFSHVIETIPPPLDGERIWHGTTNLYLAGEGLLNSNSKLRLNAQDGLVRNALVISEAQPAYAPAGHSLISVTLAPQQPSRSTDELDRAIRPTLEYWYGDLSNFRVHARYDVPQSLPLSRPSDGLPYHKKGNSYQVGDAFTYPSMNGAAYSARMAVEDILTSL